MTKKTWDTDFYLDEGRSATPTHGMFTVHEEIDVEDETFAEKEMYIGLNLGSEVFLMAISAVAEISMLPAITYVPKAPTYVEGVINLRGVIMSCINLRKMIGLGKCSPTPMTRVVITNIDNYQIGLLVDSISNVVAVAPEDIDTKGLALRGKGSEIICGLTRVEEKVIGIMDPAKILQNIPITESNEESLPAIA